MIKPEDHHATRNHPSEDKELFEGENELLPGVVRKKLGLSSEAMAGLFGMSEVGYRSWEMGSRRPGGAALKLLALLDAQPKKVVDWLSAI